MISQNPKTAKKMLVFVGKKEKMLRMFWNARICKDIFRIFLQGCLLTLVKNFAFLEILKILLSIFPSQPDIFLLQNHHFSSFLFQKLILFIPSGGSNGEYISLLYLTATIRICLFPILVCIFVQLLGDFHNSPS